MGKVNLLRSLQVVLQVNYCICQTLALTCVVWQVCREQFVLLHSQPILEDLSAFLVDKFAVKERY